jgi:formate dehydrogenase maturation protein FdhE
LTRTHGRGENLTARIPSLIEDHVEEQFDRLESKLISDFRELGQHVIEESTAAITNQLGERIDTLEKISAIQGETLTNLQHATRVTEARVHLAVDSIEQTLSGAVPGGFQLQKSANVLHALPNVTEEAEVVKADHREMEDTEGKGYCPKCTSSNVRRAQRSGLFEEFLRLFFIAPFRCRACRHKFYKF